MVLSIYISPIYKSGDSSMPENYRGIAINSCIGKLFNTVLNNRLDKYLIDNNLTIYMLRTIELGINCLKIIYD
jgi:hypothetical protein